MFYFCSCLKKISTVCYKILYPFWQTEHLQAVHLPWGGFFISMASWVMYVQIFSNLSGLLSFCFSEFHLSISPGSFNSIQYRNTLRETETDLFLFFKNNNEAKYYKIYVFVRIKNSNLPTILEWVPDDNFFKTPCY